MNQEFQNPQDLPKINKEELDLTEEELNRIFFASDKPNQSKGKDNNEPEQKPKIDGRKTKVTQKKIENALNPEPKRPHGRPRVWTPEKLEVLKLEKERQKAERLKEKQSNIYQSKATINEPFTDNDKRNLAKKILDTEENIKKHFNEKRNKLKELDTLNKKQYPFLRNSKSKCEHEYYLHHINLNSTTITANCKICSEIKIMEITEWARYIQRERVKTNGPRKNIRSRNRSNTKRK